MGLKKCYVTHWVELSKPDKNSEVFSNMESGNISIAYNDEETAKYEFMDTVEKRKFLYEDIFGKENVSLEKTDVSAVFTIDGGTEIRMFELTEVEVSDRTYYGKIAGSNVVYIGREVKEPNIVGVSVSTECKGDKFISKEYRYDTENGNVTIVRSILNENFEFEKTEEEELPIGKEHEELEFILRKFKFIS